LTAERKGRDDRVHRLPFDGRAPSAPHESLAVLVRGHEVAPRTQTDDSHDAIIDIDWLVGEVEQSLSAYKAPCA
jgi:hypothetical protein